MKIYLAYRDGYRQNTRFIKEYESDSILSWFQNNWDCFGNDGGTKFSNLMGDANIYGFRIGLLEDESYPEKPKDIEDLKKKLNYYFYVDPEVIGNEDCLQVPTDDDEIQLAWFMFTEKYKNENWENLCLWFTEEISTNFGLEGKKIEVEKHIIPEGDFEGRTYFVGCSIYDGLHLTSLSGAYSIEGVRLPGLTDYFRLNSINYNKVDSVEEHNMGFKEFKVIEILSKKAKDKELKEILEISNQIPYSEIWSYCYYKKVKLESLSIEEMLSLSSRVNETKSKLKISEHFCELSTNISDGTYNYSFLFDDLWVEENPFLAKSIIRFGTTWKI